MIKGIMFDMGGTLVNVSLKEGAFMVIYNHLVDKPKDLDEFLAFSKQASTTGLSAMVTPTAPIKASSLTTVSSLNLPKKTFFLA